MSRSAVLSLLRSTCLLLAAVSTAACSASSPDTSTASSAPDGREGSSAPGDSARLAFTEVTGAAGLGGFTHENGAFGRRWYPEQMGSGAGFFDYDGDGRLDVVLVGGGTWPAHSPEHAPGGVPALRLYRNRGNGTFREVTEEAGLGGVYAYGTGVLAADYDRDGDRDLLFTTLNENYLFENENGTFREVTEEVGLGGSERWSSSAIFFDADRDGHLDLYVANYVGWTPETDKFCAHENGEKAYCIPAVYDGVASSYYHNDGDGTFTERTEEAGFTAVRAPGKSLGVTTMDYDRDGWPDLMVANDGMGDFLFRSDGDGTFTEVGMRTGVAFSEHGEARAGMGIASGDLENSGRTSVVVGNFSEEMIGVYRYDGRGSFVDRAGASQVGYDSMLSLTFGLFLSDLDLDGFLDLFAANGHVYPYRTADQDDISYRQNPQVFLNRGDGTFRELAELEGGLLESKLVARGAAYGDYDRDGDVDLLVTENGGPAHLWRNDSEGGSFLRVRVRGRASNRDGLGAEVIVRAGGERMRRRVQTGSSYLSQSETTVTFGLGAARRADSLIVAWPSGRVDRFADLAGDRQLHVVEGADSVAVDPLPGADRGGTPLQAEVRAPEPAGVSSDAPPSAQAGSRE